MQKAGTGELQTWLSVHPLVTVHGGEVHFFDGRRAISCSKPRKRAHLRLQYAHFLWRRRPLRIAEQRGRLLFEKTPAYFDRASPLLLACAVPSARLIIMLRDPADRARSAYAMCQRELHAAWCKPPFDEALNGVLAAGEDGAPYPVHSKLRRSPHVKRMLLMGQYSVFIRRWVHAVGPSRVRVLWLEQFKKNPFACMTAVEAFASLSHHDYRSVATRNAAGLYVVGNSKSSSVATSSDAAAAIATRHLVSSSTGPAVLRGGRSVGKANASEASRAALARLRDYYAPWQRRLHVLLDATNTSLCGSLDERDAPLPC